MIELVKVFFNELEDSFENAPQYGCNLIASHATSLTSKQEQHSCSLMLEEEHILTSVIVNASQSITYMGGILRFKMIETWTKLNGYCQCFLQMKVDNDYLELLDNTVKILKTIFFKWKQEGEEAIEKELQKLFHDFVMAKYSKI